MSAKTRAEILDSAKKCVCEDRNGQYGEPEDSYVDAAGYIACGGGIELGR